MLHHPRLLHFPLGSHFVIALSLLLLFSGCNRGATPKKHRVAVYPPLGEAPPPPMAHVENPESLEEDEEEEENTEVLPPDVALNVLALPINAVENTRGGFVEEVRRKERLTKELRKQSQKAQENQDPFALTEEDIKDLTEKPGLMVY